MKKIDERKWILYKDNIYYSLLKNHSGLYLMAEIKQTLKNDKIVYNYHLLKCVYPSDLPKEIVDKVIK